LRTWLRKALKYATGVDAHQISLGLRYKLEPTGESGDQRIGIILISIGTGMSSKANRIGMEDRDM
jgi:hypothetical protein